MSTLWKVLTRKKVIDPARTEETSLARVLNTVDLTALGVGSTLGVGMYVLVGKVARETAGPSVVISFLIAAIASAFAGLCYAEFGARAPRAGSAYVYSYVCVGEFVAFVIGWNLILEYIIGSASVARGMSLYIDALLNDTMKNTFIDFAPIHVSFLSPYFDFLSFSIAIVLSIGLAFGMKESSKINNGFTFVNIVVVLFVIIAGSTRADPKNWNLDAPTNVTDAGTGGFLPFGVGGMIKGAATCFYGFVGFDCIATTGEEVKNPQRAIPIAIIVSLAIVFLAYFGTATVVTLMVPYYLQDVNSPIPHAFDEFGWVAAKWIVTFGGIFALCASLFGAMFPLPRIIYAMASDGLVFKFLGKVSERFLTPVTGTLLAGLLTGLMAAMFEQGTLVDMMSIGTLLAYTIVAACVLLLRYVENSSSNNMNPVNEEREYSVADDQTPDDHVTISRLFKQFFNGRRTKQPTKVSEKLVNILVCVYCLLCLLLGLCAIYLATEISQGVIYAIVLPSVCGILMIITLISITTQPNSREALTFKVPFVPLIPAISILVNIYLMLSLDESTWIRFGIWMAIGLPIYFYSAFYYKKDTLAFKEVEKESGKNSFTNFSYMHDETKGSVNSDSAYLSDENKSNEDFLKNGSISSVNSKKTVMPLLKPAKEDNFHNMIDRKVSFTESISNCYVEENVVALIHREDEPVIEAVNLTRENSVEDCFAVISEFDEMVKMEEEKLNVPEAPNNLIIESAKTVTAEEGNCIVDDKLVKNDSNHYDELNENDLYGLLGAKKDVTETVENTNIILEENNEDEVTETVESEVKTDEKVLDVSDNKETENVITIDEDILSNSMLESEDQNLDNENSQNSPEFVLPPPPPPSMEAFESFKTKIPRVDSLKGKKAPKSPPPDHDLVPEVEDVDDNIQFGSKQHEKIKERLNQILSKNVSRFPLVNILTKPEPKWEVNESPVKNPTSDELIAEIPLATNKDEENNQEEEEVPVKDFRERLNNLLRSDKGNMYKTFPRNGVTTEVSKDDDTGEEVKQEIEDEAVKVKLEPRLSKTKTAISKTFPRSSIKKDEERFIHRERMGNVLSSINSLRKSD